MFVHITHVTPLGRSRWPRDSYVNSIATGSHVVFAEVSSIHHLANTTLLCTYATRAVQDLTFS